MANSTRFRSPYLKRIRSYLCHLNNLLVGLLVIVNNGNIWSDGKDPRIRYRRHNEM